MNYKEICKDLIKEVRRLKKRNEELWEKSKEWEEMYYEDV